MGNTATKIKFPVSLPLHEAASRNDTATIEKLLATVTNFENGLKALKKICDAKWSLVTFMLNVARNEKGQTSLHVAVESNSYETTVMLIKEGCNVHAQDDRGDTAFHIAVRKRLHKIALHILNLHGPLKPRDVQTEDGDTVLHVLVARSVSDKKTTKLYMDYLSTNVFNKEGYSPFHLAIKLDKLDVVKTMLEEQPHLAQQLSENGEPPLWLALKHAHQEWYLARSTDTTRKHGRTEMMQLLLEKGCDVNQKNTRIGASTIWLAMYRQDVEVIELLLRSPKFDGATVEAASLDGTSPLLLAMIKGNEKQVEQMINISANQNIWATLAQKVKFALATKADFKKVRNNFVMLNTSDQQGNTLLHMAVLSDTLEMVKGVVNAGSKNIDKVMDLAHERQCADILEYLTGILGHAIDMKDKKNTFTTLRDFPRFSDGFVDLFDPLKESETNQPSLIVKPNDLGQISYQDIKQHVIPRVNIEWSDIKKVKGAGIPTISLLSEMKRNQGCDDENTDMVRDFLFILMHIETYLREEDELFKHLGVVLLPVGSTVEGTKVGRLNELDIMFFCTKLHGFLSVKDEQTICLSEDYDISKIKELFRHKTRELDLAKFFELFMKSLKISMKIIQGKVPEKVRLFMDGSKCEVQDCQKNDWHQCHHKEPPCVCYTAVGAGLNFVWKGEDKNKDMVFTMDIVPNFYVDFNGNSNFSLRQKLIKYLMNQKPCGWVEFLKKYIRDDRIYMGQFDLEQKKFASVGIKMVNTRGDFFIRPGLNMHVTNMLENEVVHETYCFLKVIKSLTASKAKSFDLKKAISDQLKGSRMEKPKDVFKFAKQIMHSPDLRGKFNDLSQPLAEKYPQMDLVDFPAKNSSSLAIHLVSKAAVDLFNQVSAQNLEGFQQLLGITNRPAAKDMLVNGKSLLHFAAMAFNVNMTRDLLLVGCDVNLQDLDGNTPLHSMLLNSISFRTLGESQAPTMLEQFENDALGIVQLLAWHQEDVNLELQNKSGHTVFHLLAITNLGPLAEELLLSKATRDLLNIRDHKGYTAAMVACIGNQFSRKEDTIINLLNWGTPLEASDNRGFTLLYLACQLCSPKLVQYVLNCGARVNMRNNEGITPLMYACMNDNLNAVELLLQKGADVNAVDNYGVTVIGHAARMGQLDIVRLFMQFSGNVSLKSSTSIFAAMHEGKYEMVKLLIMSGADPNMPNDQGWLPLVYAASQKSLVNFVRLFLDHGAAADLAIKDQNGITPLFIASQNGHLEVVELLLKNGASVDLAINDMAKTSLYVASQNGHLSVVKLLLDNGADVNKTDSDNVSPLAKAVVNGHLNVVKVLVEAGATVDDQCMANAIQFNHKDIIEYIFSRYYQFNAAV